MNGSPEPFSNNYDYRVIILEEVNSTAKCVEEE